MSLDSFKDFHDSAAQQMTYLCLWGGGTMLSSQVELSSAYLSLLSF